MWTIVNIKKIKIKNKGFWKRLIKAMKFYAMINNKCMKMINKIWVGNKVLILIQRGRQEQPNLLIE